MKKKLPIPLLISLLPTSICLTSCNSVKEIHLSKYRLIKTLDPDKYWTIQFNTLIYKIEYWYDYSGGSKWVTATDFSNYTFFCTLNKEQVNNYYITSIYGTHLVITVDNINDVVYEYRG